MNYEHDKFMEQEAPHARWQRLRDKIDELIRDFNNADNADKPLLRSMHVHINETIREMNEMKLFPSVQITTNQTPQ